MSNDNTIAGRHRPVLLDRCIELIRPALAGGGLFVDATVGLGGHTEAVLAEFPDVQAIGIDRDGAALALASQRLTRFGSRFTPVQAVNDEITSVLEQADADAILFDLGVSSMQLDDAERGFSYAHDAPLDMRMDATSGVTAADILNGYEAAELARILRDYGEERFAKRIATEIVRRRQQAPIQNSYELVDIVRSSIPAAARRVGGNPAKRTFQAVRVEVNRELSVLANALPQALEALKVGGRLLVESYQSLEDRIVKAQLAAGTESSAPPGLPIEPDEYRPYLRSLTRGAEKADPREIAANPRAASVRLRAVERVRPTPRHLRDDGATVRRHI